LIGSGANAIFFWEAQDPPWAKPPYFGLLSQEDKRRPAVDALRTIIQPLEVGDRIASSGRHDPPLPLVLAARPGKLYAKLGAFALADSLCVVASLVFILTRPGDLGSITLALVYFASALPFFFAGTVVSIAISEAVERVDRAYF